MHSEFLFAYILETGTTAAKIVIKHYCFFIIIKKNFKLFVFILGIFSSLYIICIRTDIQTNGPERAHVHSIEPSDLQLCLRSHQLN